MQGEFMNIETLYNQHLIIFAISTLADILICTTLFALIFKVFKAKKIGIENNREIHEHDKVLFELQERFDEFKNG